jgi:hypothetical protein
MEHKVFSRLTVAKLHHKDKSYNRYSSPNSTVRGQRRGPGVHQGVVFEYGAAVHEPKLKSVRALRGAGGYGLRPVVARGRSPKWVDLLLYRHGAPPSRRVY